MHAGSIENDLTAAARVYKVLRKDGGWVGGWELQDRALTTAVSTRVSEVRHQLKAATPITECIERKQVGPEFFYRIVRVEQPQTAEQLALV